jgi:hypothetical protein
MRSGNGLIRFRCANYPDCRTFVKIEKENHVDESIPPKCAGENTDKISTLSAL